MSKYDYIPYPNTVTPNTAPSHLSLCADWFNIQDISDHSFQYTELGSGNAANLISLTLYHTDATFIGIDNSESELDIGRKAIDILHLDNIQLIYSDIRDLDPTTLPPSDYIVTHGL